MSAALRALATERLVADYHRLLRSDWSKDLADQILACLWASLAEGTAGDGHSLPRVLDPAATALGGELRGLVQALGQATRFLPLANKLPKLPLDYDPPKRPSKVVVQALRLAAGLTLRAHSKLAGDVEFFRDLQALAFHAAVHFILPALRAKDPAEHAILLHALALFPLEYLASDPAQCYYLFSLLYGYCKDTEMRLHLLEEAFRLTRPDDHTFLTRAQEYWSELLDAGRAEEAERFLFSLHRWALPSQQDEVREMMVSAIRYIDLRAKQRAGAGR